MTQPRRLTIAEYVEAFETWASVAKLTDGQRAVLDYSLVHLRATFTDDTLRDTKDYCAAFESHLSERDEDPSGDARRLRLLITKSCLLDRLIHCGEALRAVPCPEHKGRWSGLHSKPCPHGCSIGCGCTTGWLPSLDTAVRSYVGACAMMDTMRKDKMALRQEIRRVTEERDNALRRARTATQTIVDEIGADGPMSVEDAAIKSVAAIRKGAVEGRER